MKMQTLLGAAAAATAATFAGADIDLDFTDFTAAGSQFTIQGAGLALDGVLDTADGAFTLVVEGQSYTWADDLCVMIANEDLSDLLVQIGGYSDYGAASKFSWLFGSAGAAGTEAGGLVDIGGIDVSGYYLWLGNGYGGGGDGVWTGTINLGGSIVHVPAPGALALLGLGGLVTRRRRS
jgi:hypothetical protein